MSLNREWDCPECCCSNDGDEYTCPECGCENPDAVIDYTDCFPDCIATHAKGRNVIILRSIDPILASRHRFDGKRASYQIQTRFLSRNDRPGTDDYVCVLHGPELEYWQAKELPALHKAIRAGREINLFEHLHCY